MFGTPIEKLTISQMKEEFRSLYGIKDFSDVVELKDMQAKLATTRNTQLITHGLNYGPLLQIGNRQNPTGIVTLSHGLGDSAHGWESVAVELSRALPYLLFLLPTAPMRPVTINGGMSMNAWYDIKALGDAVAESAEDVEGVVFSADYLTSLAYTATHRHRIPSNRVVFTGFSQGAAVSLAAGMTSRIAPAGVAVLSGYLAGSSDVLSRLCNKATPILMCHGTEDGIVPLEAAQRSKSALEAAGVTSITFKTYPMEHSSHPVEINDVTSFLKKVLPENFSSA